ncbi:MAG: Ig-like domain-containing protein [Polaribacter sp.]
MSNCAKTGRPEGGPKDEDAPIFVTAKPPYKSLFFKEKEIRIEFDEFVRMKDLNKQLIVSPPLKNPPLISPQGSPSKEIKIKILDTLQENTTYIFNFGNAVVDNNESNVLENFSYVFSTGDYIDSLTTKGSVKEAGTIENKANISLLLYRLDSSYTDSIVYKKKPNYVTKTQDSVNFSFFNLRKGSYKVIALKEEISDYIFNPKMDRIGFLNDTISLPQDSIIETPIVYFYEDQPFEFARGKELTKGKIQFGFTGNRKNFSVSLLSKVPDSFQSVAKYEQGRDSLNYWFTPIDRDSLNFVVQKDDFIDTVTVRLRKKKIDSLLINPSIRRTLHFRDTFFLRSNTPITLIDSMKISILDKDTLNVPFTVIPSLKENKVGIVFEKKPVQKYSIKLLPNALKDIYEVSHDTLNYSLYTQEIEDYGRITLNVNNSQNKNVIVQLLSGRNQTDVIEQRSISGSESLIFDLLEPKKYTVRAIIDDNKNNKWDTGNFLLKRQPEVIIFHPELRDFELRANYFLEEIFTIN